MYEFDKLTPDEQAKVVALRRARKHPWHSPPHSFGSDGLFHLYASCYQHAHHIGYSLQRLVEYEASLMDTLIDCSCEVFAWCILPNHYHALLKAPDIKQVISAIGTLHGRSSYTWNGEENMRGRTVWCRANDRSMRSERHFWATMNYVHNNPVKHGYVKKWRDWPFSSAPKYLDKIGMDEAERIWREYPIDDYGKGWDD